MSKERNTNEIIDFIVENTDHSHDEIRDYINKTIESMDNMITEEGAAIIVADNLGVTVDEDNTVQAFEIATLLPAQSNVSVNGRVKKIFPARSFNRKDGNAGKVQNIEILDSTGSIRVALWDGKVDLLQQRDVKVGDIIKISGASTKMGREDSLELSLGLHATIEVDNTLDSFPEIENAPLVPISSINLSQNEVSIEVKLIEKKDIISFESGGKPGRVMNVVLQDLTGSIELTLWHENIDVFEQISLGSILSISNVKVNENKYNVIHLTYTSSSVVKSIEKPELTALKVRSGDILDNLGELSADMTNLTILGKIISIDDLREFERNGEKRTVQSITLGDSHGTVKVTFWGEDTKVIDLMNLNSLIKLTNCRSRLNNYSGSIELTYSSRSKYSIATDEEVDGKDFSPSNETIKLSSISTVMNGVSVKGLISRVFEKRDVTLKDGGETTVQNFILKDSDGTTAKVAAWGEDISLLPELEEETAVLLLNVRTKPGDENYGPNITLNKSSIVQLIEKTDLDPMIQSADMLMSTHYADVSLEHLAEGSNVKITATVVKVVNTFIYDGCSRCQRKVERIDSDKGICVEHNEVEISPKLILTLSVDDLKAIAIVKFFGKEAERLIGMSAAEAKEKNENLSDRNAAAEHLNMQELHIEGSVKKDQNNELIINAKRFSYVDHNEETKKNLQKFEGW